MRELQLMLPTCALMDFRHDYNTDAADDRVAFGEFGPRLRRASRETPEVLYLAPSSSISAVRMAREIETKRKQQQQQSWQVDWQENKGRELEEIGSI